MSLDWTAPAMPRTVSIAEGGECLMVGALPADWDPEATAASHRTWDDAGKSGRVVAMLRALRACGPWEVHATNFGERASFLSGVSTPHVDIVAIPQQTTSDVGMEVVDRIASILTRPCVPSSSLGEADPQAAPGSATTQD